jgi:hypothetical protein
VNYDLEIILKEGRGLILRYYHSINLDRLRETNKQTNKNMKSLCEPRYEPGLNEYEAGC